MQSFDWKIALLIFFAYLCIDGLYVFYTLSVTKLQAVKAATAGALMYLLLAVGIVNYIHNFLYLIPLIAGSWLGTYIVVIKQK